MLPTYRTDLPLLSRIKGTAKNQSARKAVVNLLRML